MSHAEPGTEMESGGRSVSCCFGFRLFFPEPVLKAGGPPVVEVDFVEGWVTAIGEPLDDLRVRAAVGEHGVKVILNVVWKAADLASRLPNLNGGIIKVRLAGDGSPHR